MQKHRNEKIILLTAVIGSLLLFAGCGKVEEEKDTLVIVENNVDEPVYDLAVAVIDDVIRTESIKCTYKQVNDQEVSFDLSGKVVSVVYVKSGDAVEKGQLLAELTDEGIEEEIEQLTYNIARNQLLYDQCLINEVNDLEGRRLRYTYQSGWTTEEKESCEQDLAEIQRTYQYLQEDYQDAIYADNLRLEELQKELAQGRIYADMDGTVSYVKMDLEGSTSVKGETVIRIIDGSECVFETDSTEYAEYFTADTRADFLIVTSSGVKQCVLVPFQMEAWGEKMYFQLSEDSEGLNVGVGSAGTMRVVLEQKEQVLTVPRRAVHVADGKTYVYVTGDDDMREVRWVETGLSGDGNVEILSGLTEGEKVILK
ncbi:MAG: efflux RND transporter periplasmic adaptor subunit [Lachnospiraceae bacterium]